MKNGDSNGDPRCVDEKEHTQLVQYMPRSGVGIGPVPVEQEIAGDRTDERDRPCSDQFEIEKVCQKIHDTKINGCSNCTNGCKL
jgi:hypothetical protein